MNDKLKVFINKTLNGELTFEEEQYVFNYLQSSSKIVDAEIVEEY